MSQVAAFRLLCEAHCRREIEARVVCLVSQGTHVELQKTVTSTRLYENLTAAAPCMAVYDVKNAKLCRVFEDKDNLLTKEPALDETDFERFATTVHPLLEAGRDIFWVFAGRAPSNVPKIRKSRRNSRCGL